MAAHTKTVHVFAIVRVDTFQGLDASPEEMITVKKVVWDQATAEREVERLNTLNADKGCVYFWQMTRLETATASTTLLDDEAPVVQDRAA